MTVADLSGNWQKRTPDYLISPYSLSFVSNKDYPSLTVACETLICAATRFCHSISKKRMAFINGPSKKSFCP